MMHKAWCRIEEVHYYFSRSSIKFEGHTGWKIDLNPIWVRLLGRSQLSNPSDLPCFSKLCVSHSFVSFCIYLVRPSPVSVPHPTWHHTYTDSDECGQGPAIDREAVYLYILVRPLEFQPASTRQLALDFTSCYRFSPYYIRFPCRNFIFQH